MDLLTSQQSVALYAAENPFTSPAAYRTSNYSAIVDNKLVRLLDWHEPLAQARLADKAMRGFIGSSAFSCVAGKAAIRSGGYRFGYYRGFSDLGSTEGLARDLVAFVAESRVMPVKYATFVAVFEEAACGDERWFERALWNQLQRLAELSGVHYRWDAAVSSDADARDFAFSFAGSAFFVVGMHPEASRLSRRFFLPALAFNAHRQFRHARRDGRFERIKLLVRQREMESQGSINPELSEFGERSEARQYSGRRTEKRWRCPFQAPS